MFKASVAEKEKLKIMLGLSGPSGSGKTYSALQLAHGITGSWSRIAFADTENGSALYYAGDRTGPWQHIPFSSTMKNGYSPENWVKLIDYAESLDIDALILDSISHEWEGTNGCLELVDSLAGKSAFSNGWKIVTPLHRAFIDKMRHSRLHIVATMRSKQDYVVETNANGKAVPRKVGTKSIQREGSDYEFGLIFDIDMGHFATSSKDRTGLFAGRTPFKIDADTGRELLTWANSGVAAAPPAATPTGIGFDPNNAKHVEKLSAALHKAAIPGDAHQGFVDRMVGKPYEHLDTLFQLYDEAQQ